MDRHRIVRWAAGQAAEFLAGSGDRWAHVRAVARRADAISRVVDEVDRPVLVAAAWLHDIGYADALVATGFHPLDGARHLRALGEERLARLLAYHSSAAFEAEERGLSARLAEFRPEFGPVADALTYADMTTGPQGQPLRFEERVREILARYPPTAPAHQALARAHPDLDAMITRTTDRLERTRGQPMYGVGRRCR